MSATLAVFLPLVLAAATAAADDTASYAEAHRLTAETGKPLMVMVSTDWCMPCRDMKKNVIPQVKEDGVLSKVAFATVNPDKDHELAEKITGGGPVPQLVMFRKTPLGWLRRKLIGGQSVHTVEQFIETSVAENEADKQATKKTETAAPAETKQHQADLVKEVKK